MQSDCDNCQIEGKSDDTINVDVKDESEDNDSSLAPLMSKKQLKRLMRNKKWLEERPERRRRETEKRKAKKAELKAKGLLQSRLGLKSAFVAMSDSKCKISVAIDCDFEQFMTDRDMKKLIKQIGRCYSVNRRAANPVQMYVTSVANGIRERFVTYQSGFANWDAKCVPNHWSDVFADKSRVVYLTSDSDNVVSINDDISDSNAVYIIGGLVDHNKFKGLSHERAVSYSVSHGRLPIDQFVNMSQRRILAVNHVFEIILGVVNGGSWQQVFESVIPQRKLHQNSSNSN